MAKLRKGHVWCPKGGGNRGPCGSIQRRPESVRNCFCVSGVSPFDSHDDDDVLVKDDSGYYSVSDSMKGTIIDEMKLYSGSFVSSPKRNFGTYNGEDVMFSFGNGKGDLDGFFVVGFEYGDEQDVRLIDSNMAYWDRENEIAEFFQECRDKNGIDISKVMHGDSEIFADDNGYLYFHQDFYQSNWHNHGDTYKVRMQFDREITDEEMQRACQLLGYQYRSAVAGESLGDPIRDGANSFNVYADFTKSRRDDLGDAYYDLENGIGTMIKEGSPIRKTDRSGPGTKGTRLVDGLGDGLNPQLYYS